MTDVHWIPAGIVLAYVLLLVLVTAWAERRPSARSGVIGYLLAGRQLPASVTAAMLAGLAPMLAPFASNGQMQVTSLNRVLRQLINQNFTYRDILLLGPNGLPIATALPACSTVK